MAEIAMILVGVVWGLGEGFGIVSIWCAQDILLPQVAAGTILGEIANYMSVPPPSLEQPLKSSHTSSASSSTGVITGRSDYPGRA